MKKWTKTRRRLEEQLALLERRVRKIGDDLNRKTNRLGKDSEDQAAVLQNDEVLGSLEQEGREQIQAILAALERIDAGTYGLCADCNARIPEARLEAVPYTIRCRACAEKLEKVHKSA